MAETAVARLRGILAERMTRGAIDQLLADVRAEWAETWQPAPDRQYTPDDDLQTAAYMAMRAASREQPPKATITINPDPPAVAEAIREVRRAGGLPRHGSGAGRD